MPFLGTVVTVVVADPLAKSDAPVKGVEGMRRDGDVGIRKLLSHTEVIASRHDVSLRGGGFDNLKGRLVFGGDPDSAAALSVACSIRLALGIFPCLSLLCLPPSVPQLLRQSVTHFHIPLLRCRLLFDRQRRTGIAMAKGSTTEPVRDARIVVFVGFV